MKGEETRTRMWMWNWEWIQIANIAPRLLSKMSIKSNSNRFKYNNLKGKVIIQSSSSSSNNSSSSSNSSSSNNNNNNSNNNNSINNKNNNNINNSIISSNNSNNSSSSSSLSHLKLKFRSTNRSDNCPNRKSYRSTRTSKTASKENTSNPEEGCLPLKINTHSSNSTTNHLPGTITAAAPIANTITEPNYYETTLVSFRLKIQTQILNFIHLKTTRGNL